MTNAPLVLYVDAFWISPWAFSAYVALKEKGVPFEVRPIALQEKQQRRPEFRDRSLTGLVPALDHGGAWIAESSAIVEYVDECFPEPPLLPATAHERARARMVLSWLRCDLRALREDRPTSTMFYQRATAPLTPAGAEAAEKLVRVAGAVLDGKSTISGEWSIADSDLAFTLHRLILNGYEIPAALRAYAETQWARPSVRSFVERERIPYVDY